MYILPNKETVRHPASCISDKLGSLRGEDYIPDRWYTLASSKIYVSRGRISHRNRLFLILLKKLLNVKYKMH
jgi:hypothetical protein